MIKENTYIAGTTCELLEYLTLKEYQNQREGKFSDFDIRNQLEKIKRNNLNGFGQIWSLGSNEKGGFDAKVTDVLIQDFKL